MRILIVEDEFLPALILEEELRSAGWETLGPFSNLSEARSASLTNQFDIAVLDINLNGELVYPLASDLAARGIPFIFLSGYIGRDLPEHFRNHPRLSKPPDPIVLKREILRLSPVP